MRSLINEAEHRLVEKISPRNRNRNRSLKLFSVTSPRVCSKTKRSRCTTKKNSKAQHPQSYFAVTEGDEQVSSRRGVRVVRRKRDEYIEIVRIRIKFELSKVREDVALALRLCFLVSRAQHLPLNSNLIESCAFVKFLAA